MTVDCRMFWSAFVEGKPHSGTGLQLSTSVVSVFHFVFFHFITALSGQIPLTPKGSPLSSSTCQTFPLPAPHAKSIPGWERCQVNLKESVYIAGMLYILGTVQNQKISVMKEKGPRVKNDSATRINPAQQVLDRTKTGGSIDTTGELEEFNSSLTGIKFPRSLHINQ